MRQLVFLSTMVFIFPALMVFGETVNPLDTPTVVPKAADTIKVQIKPDSDRVNKPVMQKTEVIIKKDKDDGVLKDAKSSDSPVIKKTDVIIKDKDDGVLNDDDDMDVD